MPQPRPVHSSSRVLGSSASDGEEVAVSRAGPVVEAFPNGFLGVLMPEKELLSAPKLRRGLRFDRLCERMVTTGRLESVLSKSLKVHAKVWAPLGL